MMEVDIATANYPSSVGTRVHSPRMPSEGHILPESYVRKVARLARLAPSDDEVRDAQRRLSAIVTYMNRLKELDLAGVEPMAHVGDSVNRLDEDTPGPTLANATLLKMAPATDGPFVKIPKVIDES